MIKDSKLLEETSKIVDLLDITKKQKDFDYRINSLPDSSILALVGGFGSGKSTFLYQIMLEHQEDQTWIEFDAWKYPNRDNLWEGFVLDVADQIGELSSIKKQVDGKSGKSVVVDIATDVLGLISEKLEGLNFLDKFTDFFKKSPATRVFELQDILKQLIESTEKDVFIIIEDIDRSGDAGIYFLETLKQFLRTVKLDRKIIVIVPMANHSYYSNLDSYLKSIDYFDFFEIDNLKLNIFVESVFLDELFAGEKRRTNGQVVWTGTARKAQTSGFFEALFKEFPEMNLRLLKLIIRKASVVYVKQVEDGHHPDFRITLCIEASKYFKLNTENSLNRSFFEEYKSNNTISDSSVFSAFLYAIYRNMHNLYDTRRDKEGIETHSLESSPVGFKFIERENNDIDRFPSEVWSFSSVYDDARGLGIAKFYIKY